VAEWSSVVGSRSLVVWSRSQRPQCRLATGHSIFTLTARTVDVLWTGRGELQNQLDAAVEELRLKLNAVQEVERNAVRAAMLEERARYCLFIGAIKPLIVCI